MRFPTTGSGKGCRPRPSTISREDYEMRWDYIFRDAKYKDLEFDEWKRAIKESRKRSKT